MAIHCWYHVFLLCILMFSVVIEDMKYSCHDLIQLIFLPILLKLSFDMPYWCRTLLISNCFQLIWQMMNNNSWWAYYLLSMLRMLHAGVWCNLSSLAYGSPAWSHAIIIGLNSYPHVANFLILKNELRPSCLFQYYITIDMLLWSCIVLDASQRLVTCCDNFFRLSRTLVRKRYFKV